jgi:O-acetyl-ADP-ribose deacetylase (regulator of RNase III)
MLTRIELFRGDITTLTADAIVNAANPGLTPGGAVGMAIHRAAGPELKAECMSLMQACHPGSAVITRAYRLSALNPNFRERSSNSSWRRGVMITTTPIRKDVSFCWYCIPTVRGQKDIKGDLGMPQQLAVPE